MYTISLCLKSCDNAMTNILYETPYERYFAFGPTKLTDAELLAIILRNGSKEHDVLELANLLLEKYDSSKRIIGLNNYEYNDLINIKGIGAVKAMCVGALLELSKLLHQQKYQRSCKLSDSTIISDIYMEKMRHLKQECVYLLLVDTKCVLLNEILLSSGTFNEALISVKDILFYALHFNASAFIVLHNHPSGDPTPSDSDIKTTLKIFKASKIIEIPLLDHIIIGDNSFFSFKAMGYI